ncbi:hypothetical protein AM588_10001377 [Phytophthora nicotianae]|uniref:Uncharacterized protein n=1 Tax=Phytophthora nicotianae TaxID=4792 RepID=A0A0W8CSG4_PHYNI|nr:hypothetical protein AM588_10001377 [Phytophthora nicotianae]
MRGVLRGVQQNPMMMRQVLQSTRPHTFLRRTNADKPLSWATWLQENIPKGFGRFYPKNGASGAGKAGGPPKTAPKTGEKGAGDVKKLSSKTAEKKTGGSGGSGSGGGPNGKDGMAYLVPLAVAALFLSDLASIDKPMQEITYQEFRNTFLESGRVKSSWWSTRNTSRCF